MKIRAGIGRRQTSTGLKLSLTPPFKAVNGAVIWSYAYHSALKGGVSES